MLAVPSNALVGAGLNMVIVCQCHSNMFCDAALVPFSVLVELMMNWVLIAVSIPQFRSDMFLTVMSDSVMERLWMHMN